MARVGVKAAAMRRDRLEARGETRSSADEEAFRDPVREPYERRYALLDDSPDDV